MIVYYVENEIDMKYQSVFLRSVLPSLLADLGDELSSQFFLFYRKVPGLIPSDKILEFINGPKKSLISKDHKQYKTIPKLLKLMNTLSNKSTLITSYNFQKRGINKYDNIDVINLGHSISGNTRYNLKVWVEESKPGSVSLVPRFFSMVKGGSYHGRNKSRNKVEMETYYKLLYTLTKPVTYPQDDSTILFLPHWTTPINKLKSMVESINIPDGHRLLIKLHPASIYETTIFLNRTVKSEATSQDGETIKKLQKEYYDSVVNEITSIKGVFIYDDDELELIDGIDKAKYLIFDGHSNTLPESIFRSMYHGMDKSIAVMDPHTENPSYVMPDLFGYDYLESIDSLDDFTPPNQELLSSYIDVCCDDFTGKVVSEYQSVLSSTIKSTYEKSIR